MKLKLHEQLLIVALFVLIYFQYGKPGSRPPKPDNPPITSGKLWVLMVEETSQRNKLPPAQVTALTADAPREYLNTHCDKENGTATYRLYDKDQDVTNESKEWQDELEVLKKETPPTIAFRTTGALGRTTWTKPQPFPKDTDSFLTLLRKYGGK